MRALAIVVFVVGTLLVSVCGAMYLWVRTSPIDVAELPWNAVYRTDDGLVDDVTWTADGVCLIEWGGRVTYVELPSGRVRERFDADERLNGGVWSGGEPMVGTWQGEMVALRTRRRWRIGQGAVGPLRAHGDRIYTECDDHLVALNIATGSIALDVRIPLQGTILTYDILPTTEGVVVVTSDVVLLMDRESGKVLSQRPGSFYSAAPGPRGPMISLCNGSGPLAVYTLPGLELVFKKPLPWNAVHWLDRGPEQACVAVCGLNEGLWLWDFASGNRRRIAQCDSGVQSIGVVKGRLYVVPCSTDSRDRDVGVQVIDVGTAWTQELEKMERVKR